MASVSIRVTGLVQGVSFRVYAQRAATRLGLSGFVQNRPDDSVYLEVHGPDHQVSQFIDWCHEGPPQAAVTSVETAPIEPQQVTGFTIRG